METKKIIGFAVGPVSSAILGFASLPILAWYFSAEDIGRISLLQVVINFAVILCSLGLDQAYVREYHESGNKPSLLRTAVLPGFLILSLVVVGIQLIAPQLLSKLMFDINSSVFSLLVCICLLSALLSRFLSLILRMQEKGLAFSMSQVLPKFLFLLIIVSYVYSGSILTFQKLLIAQVLSIVIIFVIYTWNTRLEWQPALASKIDYLELKSMIHFGLPLIFGGIASWLLMAMDRMFLRSLSSFEELGVYSIAASVAATAGVVTGIFSTIWAPTVFKWAASGENLEKIDQIREMVVAVVYFILCLGGLFSWVIPYVLPHTYISVQYLVIACMIVPLFYMISETSAVGIAISRKSQFSLLASCIAASINAVGNFFLVPHFGSAGAAISTAFAFWIFLVCRTEFSCLVWKSFPRLKLYITTFLGLCASILFAMYGKAIGHYSVVLWLVLFVIGLFVFKNFIGLLKLRSTQVFLKLKKQ